MIRRNWILHSKTRTTIFDVILAGAFVVLVLIFAYWMAGGFDR